MDAIGQDEVELSFRASTRFVRLSRLAASALAAEMGFDIESVDDLRIAVDELVALLVSGDHGEPVTLTYRPASSEISIEGSCAGEAVTTLDMPDLVEAILSATTDAHDYTSAAGLRRFVVRKQLGPQD